MTGEADVARRILGLLDLTNLEATCGPAEVKALCGRAVGPAGTVAAICVWPQFVGEAKRLLGGGPVRVATVINFPNGGEDLERVVEDTEEALGDGADEIDLVMPWRAFLAGDLDLPGQMIRETRDVMPSGHRLKVIFETGSLPDDAAIVGAARLAIESGADFLKTSTGKMPVSATPEAARLLLETTAASDRPVGFKAAGGIRTLQEAAIYLDLADSIMGPGWATPSTFRIGASSLHGALVAAIEGSGSGAATPAPTSY
jgi:deoxyribose-phosphate aldolase